MANRVDTFPPDKKVIVGQIDRAIALVVQFLQLPQDVLGRSAAPLAIGEGGDVAVDAGIGAASRSLHRAEFVEREDGGDVQGQGLDVVDGQALPVRVGELVQVLDKGTGAVVDDLGAVTPDQPGYGTGVVEVAQ